MIAEKVSVAGPTPAQKRAYGIAAGKACQELGMIPIEIDWFLCRFDAAVRYEIGKEGCVFIFCTSPSIGEYIIGFRKGSVIENVKKEYRNDR